MLFPSHRCSIKKVCTACNAVVFSLVFCISWTRLNLHLNAHMVGRLSAMYANGLTRVFKTEVAQNLRKLEHMS